MLGQTACPQCGTLAAQDWRLKPEGAHCAHHLDRSASAICARCGDFLCPACSISRRRKSYCLKCITKIAPDPDLPISAWVWGGHLIFRNALLVFPLAAVAFAARTYWIAIFCGLTAFISGFLLGRKYARAIHRSIPGMKALMVSGIGLGFQFIALLALYRVFAHLLTGDNAALLFLISIPSYLLTTYLGIIWGGTKEQPHKE